MKYRDKEDLKQAIKEILRAGKEKVDELPDRPVKKEIEKIREMDQ